MIPDLFSADWFLAAATAATALSGYYLWRITRREDVLRLRLEALRGSSSAGTRAPRLPWYRRLGSLIAASPIIGTVEQQRLLKLLTAAGIKRRSSLANFVAAKVCSAVVFILNRLAKQRRLRLERGMPDALDLLVVCAEAGLSLNQSIEEISRQLRPSNKDVADEFATTSAEMRVFSDFGQALDNMVERTGLDELRGLIATLKQTLKFGTPLAESLRMIAAEMRAARHARIEERAARLPVLLAIPMMMFILPCLLMIVGTPVALRIIDVFKTITFGVP